MFPRHSSVTYDRGDTLVEVLVALVVVGTAVVALMGGLAVQSRATVNNRYGATVSALLNSAAEYVKSQSNTSVCALSSAVQVPTTAVPYDTAKWVVQYGPGVAFNSSTPCTQLALVTVSVSSVAAGGYHAATTVSKRP